MALSVIAGTPSAGASASLSVTRPTGSAAGDRLFVIINHNDETVNSTDTNAATTIKQGEYRSQVGGRGGFSIFYRTLTGAEPATYAYSLTSSQRWSAIPFLIRGGGAASFDVVPEFGLDETSAAPTCPGATTFTDGAIAFAIAGTDGPQSGTFLSGPATFTLLAQENTQQPMAIYYKIITPAGATGDQDFVTSLAGSNYSLSIFSIGPQSVSNSWVGMYYVSSDRIPDLVSRGVTRFHVWGPNQGFLDACLAAGAMCWVELTDAFPGGSYFPSTLIAYVNASKNHAALEGYFMKDEPDLVNYPVALMQQAYADLKSVTSKPCSTVVRYPFRTANPNGRQYTDALPIVADIFAPDPYIIPYGPASQAGSETAASVAALTASPGGNRPVYTVIQSFGWGQMFAPPYGRIPTVAEMITMGVTSREGGAPHLWVYTWNGNVENPPNDPMNNFNPLCYAELATITAAWRAVGGSPPVPSGGLRMVLRQGLFVGSP